MKKGMVYILALSAAAMLLTGCGDLRGDRAGTATATPMPTESPAVTIVPETMMPKTEDGVVQDRDGIITEDDTGKEHGDGERSSAGAGDMEKNGMAGSAAQR